MNYKCNITEYEKSDQAFLKKYNIKKVLNILRQQKGLSRIDLAEISKLDKKTVTNIIKELLEKKQVRAISKTSEGKGRPKEVLDINGEYCKCIGVDLGGTHISGVVMDFSGNVRFSHNIDLHNDMEPDMLIKLCHHIVEILLKKADLEIKDIGGMGISIPGFVDKDAGVSIISENLPKWYNIPLKKIFMEKYNTDVYIDDCSRLMALAELRFGAGFDCDDFLAFDLGLGIGCGIILNRTLYAGATGKSGEIGHSIVKVDGPLCTCGRRGCIESLASGWALSKQAQAALDSGVNTMLKDIVTAGKAEPSPKEIALATELGDEYCTNLLNNAGVYIGIGIANAISFYNPSRVIIGGRLIKDNSILLKSIKETVKKQTIPAICEDTDIVESKLGFMASAIGAASLCFEKYY